MAEEEAKAISHDELCDRALAHYRDISDLATSFNSLVPKAIEYYRRWAPTGERKLVRTPGKLEEALKEGWMFDPWLNQRGSPISVDAQQDHPVYWFLVRGTPEQIAALKPFVDLPEDEEKEPEPEFKPYGLEAMFISYDEKDASGGPKKPPEGFVIMHKDHIYAKGTVYTLQSGSVKPKPWDIAKDIAEISHLGVDEAHDVITALIKKAAS